MMARFVGQKLAQTIDGELMSASGGFSIEQLMELAGLSVAQAIFHLYPPSSHRRVLVCCGPGNNGGDGLVATRHLCHFGYQPTVLYPKEGSSELFQRLTVQLCNLAVRFVERVEMIPECDLVIDAIFGFGFKGEIRAPFDSLLVAVKKLNKPIVSVDIPSGWDVEKGPQGLPTDLQPETLISLSAPKLCAYHFKGRHHVLGGRFIPPSLAEKHGLMLPTYPQDSQFFLLD